MYFTRYIIQKENVLLKKRRILRFFNLNTKLFWEIIIKNDDSFSNQKQILFVYL